MVRAGCFFWLHPCILCQLLDLVVEPLACLGCPWLAAFGAEAVWRAAVCVEARTLRTIRQHLRAAIRLTWCLQPVVRVKQVLLGRGRGRHQAHASTADVAPVRTVGTHVSNTIAASVDDHVRLKARNAFRHGLAQVQGIVELVLRGIPFREQAAGVRAASVLWVSAVQAVVVRWADTSQGLVPGHIAGKATEVVCNVQALDGLHVVRHVVGPPQPASMTSIQVDSRLGVSSRQALHGVADSLLVRRFGRCIAASRVPRVRREIGQRVWLDDQHHRDRAAVRF
mmetsp:Transcript_33292/g.59768  ORF Transcript_33292/g.59768 Transcript_33292/m.59768 type:complete len:282 (-) Transcript_33292:331-1176(-)